jgi:hypothetical protein
MKRFSQKNKIGGVEMQGALLLDAGPLRTAASPSRSARTRAFSAVCTETISLEDGRSPWWNLYRRGNTLYNCSKWSDIPYEQWVEREIPFAKERGAVVVATVGMREEDAKQIVPALNGSGADAIKVVSYREEDMPKLVLAAKRATRLPVWQSSAPTGGTRWRSQSAALIWGRTRWLRWTRSGRYGSSMRKRIPR